MVAPQRSSWIRIAVCGRYASSVAIMLALSGKP
jgi:hypothetical protein